MKLKRVVVEIALMLPEAEVAELEQMRKAHYTKGVTLGHVAGKCVYRSDKDRIAEGISWWLYDHGAIGGHTE